MATSTNKTAAFGVKLIHKCMSRETPSHPEKLTVWCTLWAGGIIGPYFFKNDEGQIGLHPSQPWQSYARNHI
ncbi:hypothetical protein TNCV_4520721 [Trichonephila clavipes]|nr:hypothetical protein TNCV_4520721 [Trichonephila clavipes]